MNTNHFYYMLNIKPYNQFMQFDEINIVNVDFFIDKKKILKNINLKIKKNEKIAVIGPSGSGKTQLLQMISFFSKPDKGIISFNEKNFWKINSSLIKQIRKLFFFVPQTPPFPAKQSVINAIQAGYINQWSLIKVIFSLIFPIRKKQITSILNELKLEDKLYENIESLSGGEKQCVSLARLFVANAKIMIVDEPLNSLDLSRSELVLKLIAKYFKINDSTIVSSLHQPFLAKKYFNRIIGMKKGQIIFDLKTKEINKKKITELYS